uniref:Epimerase domain-containing protein n=1 Tax=Elaeophora elaphi TaxID=1147741 RepID=A0A0R3RR15_9BILA
MLLLPVLINFIYQSFSGVLVTGASGYLAMHCIQQLLQKGYEVHGTVRDLFCVEKMKPFRQLENYERLEIFRVSLEDDVHLWEKAMRNCTYVLHIASPCEVIANETIVETAVCGTLNVLRAASRLRCVEKIVLTSSSGAINFKFIFNFTVLEVGHNDRDKVFTENDWTNLNWKHLHAYHKSKILAEQAAWDFMEKNLDVSFSLTVLNPSLIVGPSLQNGKRSSATIISRFLDGSMPAYPAMKLGLVDVRDVAQAHILAMKKTQTNGQRIIISAETLSFRQIADILRQEFGKQGYSVPRFRAFYIALWLFSFVDKAASQALSLYGHVDKLDNSKSSQLLGISYRDVRKSLIEMAYDMIERNIVPRKKNVHKKKERIELGRRFKS